MANEFIARNGITSLGNIVVSGSITTTGTVAISGSIASASFATIAATASSADNLLVRNTLTAQTLVVQTITSSVDFVTGSTRFGSISENTHQFTGSVNITGSTNLAGSLKANKIGINVGDLNLDNSTLGLIVSGSIGFGNSGGAAALVDRDGSGNTTFYGGIGDIKFSDITLTSNYLTIKNAGNVGIGIANPLTRLHISSSTGGLLEVDGANAINALFVSSSGVVGIGTTTPAELIEIFAPAVGGTSQQSRLRITQAGSVSARANLVSGVISGENPYFAIETRQSASPFAIVERLRIDGSGNVGIGTTTATAKLQIANTSSGAATVALFLNNNSTTVNTETRIAFAANSNDDISTNRYSYISALNTSSSNGQALLFATNETGNSAVERMRITSGGVLDLAIGQIKFPATQVASANANTLDDYEEGTFTPDIRNGSWAFGARSGFYTKIGNLVTVNFLIVWTSNNIPSGAAFEITLPFAAFGSGNFRAPATIGYTSGINFNTSRQLVAHVDMSNNYISFQQLVSGGVPVLLTNNDINNVGEIQISVTYQV
jgi:hypothetical protein